MQPYHPIFDLGCALVWAAQLKSILDFGLSRLSFRCIVASPVFSVRCLKGIK